ncbi:MAG: hypothetical protein II307_06215, partial [Alistipes sp.]|nr:hypothetical protein [Alistipes sp.]
MENQRNKNYIPIIVLFTAMVIAVLILLIFVPGFKLGGFDFRRANILSEIYKPSADSAVQRADIVDTSYMLQDKIMGDSLSVADTTSKNKPSGAEKRAIESIVWGAKDTLKRDTIKIDTQA